MALSQAQTRLNTLTTENAVMSAQLSSSTADVARLTTSNDKWQQMCGAPAAELYDSDAYVVRVLPRTAGTSHLRAR